MTVDVWSPAALARAVVCPAAPLIVRADFIMAEAANAGFIYAMNLGWLALLCPSTARVRTRVDRSLDQAGFTSGATQFFSELL